MGARVAARLLQQVLVVIVSCWWGTARAEEEQRVHVVVCSPEPAPIRVAFTREIAPYLTFAVLEVVERCPALPRGRQPERNEPNGESTRRAQPLFLAHLASVSDGVELRITTDADLPRSRRLEWVHGGHPLEETLAQSRTAGFALVVETLLLEFETVQLMHAPSLPSAEADSKDVEPEPDTPPRAEPKEPTPERTATPPPLSPSRTTPEPKRQRTRLGVEVSGGAELLPSNVSAPALALSIISSGDPWTAALTLRQTLDSNFAVGDRPFATSTTTVALGPRWKAGQHRGLWLGAQLHVLGRWSRYRRDDLASAETRQWADLGLGALGVARVQLFESLSLQVQGGIELLPTAPPARIKNGPSRPTGVARVPLLAGAAFLF